MPRANNSGGRPSGRRGSSRNTSNFRSEKPAKGPRKDAGKGKRDDGKKSFGKSARPDFSSKEKKSAQDRNTGRFKKFSSTEGARPRGKRTDAPYDEVRSGGQTGRGSGFSNEKRRPRREGEETRNDKRGTRNDRSGFKKFDRDDKGFSAKRRPRTEGDETRNDKRGTRNDRSGFKKFDREDKGFTAKRRPRTEGEETRNDKRGTRNDRGGFKKFDRDDQNFSPKRRPRTEETRNDKRGTRSDKGERSGFFNKQRRTDKESQGYSPDLNAPVQTEKIRLNRYIANSGVCSRREADELISMGLISVNGSTITELGYKVNPGDEVRYENRVLRAEKPVYILLNKPKGYLTTTDDPQERNTVMQLIGNSVKERIYPVGRLDRNTTGLLLLTNDGDLADKLMHPSYNVKKIYKVELDRPLTRADFETILNGVKLEEGRATVDDLAIVSDDGKTVGVELHIGWNRVVRRIFESLEYQVVRLDRSVYAGLDKKDLGRGEWRYLTKEEIVRLKHYK